MFPSKRKLFNDITCPELDTCALSPCLFSHSTRTSSARPPLASTSSATLPSALKRAQPPPPTSAEEFDKRRKLARSGSGGRAVGGPSLGGGLGGQAGLVGRSAAGAARPSVGSGSRIAGIVPSRTTALVSAAWSGHSSEAEVANSSWRIVQSNVGGTTAAGTPRITHTGSLHTPLTTRQKLLDAVYTQ